MKSTHPRVYVEPIDRDERPRRYAHEFTEHEWAMPSSIWPAYAESVGAPATTVTRKRTNGGTTT